MSNQVNVPLVNPRHKGVTTAGTVEVRNVNPRNQPQEASGDDAKDQFTETAVND